MPKVQDRNGTVGAIRHVAREWCDVANQGKKIKKNLQESFTYGPRREKVDDVITLDEQPGDAKWPLLNEACRMPHHSLVITYIRGARLERNPSTKLAHAGEQRMAPSARLPPEFWSRRTFACCLLPAQMPESHFILVLGSIFC